MRHADLLHDRAEYDTVFQTSTIAALLEGAYEGDVTFGELSQHGTVGLGTVQHLDGEMIAIDGAFYVARADGRVSLAPSDLKTPFAVVVPWRADEGCALPPIPTIDALGAAVDRALPSDGTMLAIRVDGHFSRILARTVPRQRPPYEPLAAVAAQQVMFEWHDLDATLVGFRSPASVDGYDPVGYHWHVLSADRTRGGHLLDCALTGGEAAFDRAGALHVELPRGLAWQAPGASGSRDAVLKKIERAPG